MSASIESKQGSFFVNTRNEFQVVDKGGRPSSLMMLRLEDGVATLPPVVDPETNRRTWDKAWEDYVNGEQRLFELGFRRAGNVSFRVGRPLSNKEWDEVDDLTGGYGF